MKLKQFIREHPTLLLTISYFNVTIIGVIYSYYYYREFGINIIKFVDLSDFLLAPILEPFSILIFISWVLFSLLCLKLEFIMRKRFKSYGRFVEKRLNPKYSDPLFFTIMAFIFTIIFLKSLAVDNVNEMKNGEFDQYKVAFSQLNGRQEEQTLALIGGSSRYLYFYKVETKNTLIIPVENVSYMTKNKQLSDITTELKEPE